MIHKKLTALLLLFCTCTVTLCGCRYSYEISEMAYAVALGIDKGEQNSQRYTLQFAHPLKIAGQSEEGGEEQEGDSTSLISTQANDLFTALNILGNMLSKQINLTQTKLLVFSSEYAAENITEILRVLMKNNQIRPSTFAAVSVVEARDYLKEVQPSLEANPSKFYTLLFSKKNSNYIPVTTLRELYLDVTADGEEGALPLCGTAQADNEEGSNRKQSAILGNYFAGGAVNVEGSETEVAGLALFRGGSLAALLPSRGAELYNLCIGTFKPAYYHIPSDMAEGKHIILNLRQKRRPVIRVTLTNDKPNIKISFDLAAQLIECPPEEYNAKDTAALNRMAEDTIRRDVEQFLYETAQTARADAVGFGRHAKRLFASYDEWKAYQWPERYSSSSFDVHVNVNIENDGLIQSTGA